jgi:probable HAF family extracellular repeat protein
LICAAALSVTYIRPADAQPQYTVTDLGALPEAAAFQSNQAGSYSYAMGLNVSGQVTGCGELPGAACHVFLWSKGHMMDLTQKIGNNHIAYSTAMNASAQVAGQLGDCVSDPPCHAAVFSTGGLKDLGTLGGAQSAAEGINAPGQTTGWSLTTNGAQHAFLNSNGVMSDLSTLGGTTSAGWAINDSGQVTGYAATATAASHAFLYANGVMNDLGTLGGTSSAGYAINAAGQVLGTSTIAGDTAYHLFLYTNGVMNDLGTLPGYTAYAQPEAINGFGDMVGYVVSPTSTIAPFLYTKGAL